MIESIASTTESAVVDLACVLSELNETNGANFDITFMLPKT